VCSQNVTNKPKNFCSLRSQHSFVPHSQNCWVIWLFDLFIIYLLFDLFDLIWFENGYAARDSNGLLSMSMSNYCPKILAAPNQRSLAICLEWLGPNKLIFSSGRHFYLSPLVVQKVTTPLMLCMSKHCVTWIEYVIILWLYQYPAYIS